VLVLVLVLVAVRVRVRVLVAEPGSAAHLAEHRHQTHQ
jgi:hypothetical protein